MAGTVCGTGDSANARLGRSLAERLLAALPIPGASSGSGGTSVPGFGLSQYAAEQMAQANELADTNVRNAIKSTTMNAVSTDNEKALKLTTFGDRRIPGTKS